MAEPRGNGVSIRLLGLLVTAVTVALGTHLHLEAQSADKAREAIQAHEARRIEMAHPDLQRDFMTREEAQDIMHRLSTVRKDVDELRLLCEKRDGHWRGRGR